MNVRTAPVVRFCDAQRERTALRHGIHGIGDYIRKCLPNFSSKRRDLNAIVILLYNFNAPRFKPLFIEQQEIVEHLRNVEESG
jgi:hypothetical protein